MSDDPQYNEKYIEAKERQASQHKTTGERDAGHADRLPPGQILTQGFPILDLGIRPRHDEYASWKIFVRGLSETTRDFSLDEIRTLGHDERTLDFHCVTRWSRYDLPWGGMLFSRFCQLVKPKPTATTVIFHSYDKYTTNVPLAEALGKNVLIAYELEGKEIPPEHGGPVRMIVPTLYGWKSAKFLTGIEFLDHDEPGFWETRGYHNHADPWIEERYS
ncbi:MAG: molybdopterin-dependent oxidoreductase [Patescibacteria group bacterium]